MEEGSHIHRLERLHRRSESREAFGVRRLAGALEEPGAPESGSKLPHSKRFATVLRVKGGLDVIAHLNSILPRDWKATLLAVDGSISTDVLADKQQWLNWRKEHWDAFSELK